MRAGRFDNVDTLSSFDMVSRDRLDDYIAFIDTYCFGQSKAEFSVVPLGFSPYLYEFDGIWTNHVWMMVIEG